MREVYKMRELISPKATLSFYKFINNTNVSIKFLETVSGEEIIRVERITFKYRENLKIVAVNSKEDIVLIKLINGFGDYRGSRKSFKESFLDYSWEVEEIEYDKLYNIALMGFSVRNNNVDLETEEVIERNIYMLKTKEKDKEEYYINLDFPKYEKSLKSNLDKWMYLFDDIWDFERNYKEDDIFDNALDSFTRGSLSREEFARYENNRSGLMDAMASKICRLCEVYKKSYSLDKYNERIEIAKKLIEKGLSVNEVSEIIEIPQEIIIYEVK